MKKVLSILLVSALCFSFFTCFAQADVAPLMDFTFGASEWSDANTHIPAFTSWGYSQVADGGKNGEGAVQIVANTNERTANWIVTNYGIGNGDADDLQPGKTYRFELSFKVIVADETTEINIPIQDRDSNNLYIRTAGIDAEIWLNGYASYPEADDSFQDWSYEWTVPEEGVVATEFGFYIKNGVAQVDYMKVYEVVDDNNTGDDNTGDNNTGDDNTGDEGSSETGDATILFAVMAIVALFGSAVVVKKAR